MTENKENDLTTFSDTCKEIADQLKRTSMMKTYLLDYRTRLATSVVHDEVLLQCNLNWSLNNGNPRAIVFHDNAAEYTKCAMSPQGFYSVIDGLRDITTKGSDYEFIMECHNSHYEEGEMVDECKHICNLRIGKDEDGINHIGIEDLVYGNPYVKFNLSFGKWVKFQNPLTKEPVSQAVMSDRFTIGYANHLEQNMQSMLEKYQLDNLVKR